MPFSKRSSSKTPEAPRSAVAGTEKTGASSGSSEAKEPVSRSRRTAARATEPAAKPARANRSKAVAGSHRKAGEPAPVTEAPISVASIQQSAVPADIAAPQPGALASVERQPINSVAPAARRVSLATPRAMTAAAGGSTSRDPEPVPAPAASAEVTEYEIAVLAYSLWRERGSVHGSSEQDWLRAEAILRNRD